MPVLTIYGMPPELVQPSAAIRDETVVWKLIEHLATAVASVEELKISANGVSVFFPSDLIRSGLGEELIVFVDGLYEKPERTEFVLSKLAVVIRDTLEPWVKKYLPQCHRIEVFIRPIDFNRVSTVTW